MTSPSPWVSSVREILIFWTTVAHIGTLTAYAVGTSFALRPLFSRRRDEELCITLPYKETTVTIPAPPEFGSRAIAIAMLSVCLVFALLDTVLVLLIAVKGDKVTPQHYTVFAAVQTVIYATVSSLSITMLVSYTKTYLEWFPSTAFNKCLELGNTLEFSFFTHCSDELLNVIDRDIPDELEMFIGDVCDYLYTFCIQSNERLKLTIVFTSIVFVWSLLAGCLLLFLLLCFTSTSDNNQTSMGPTNEFAIPVRIQRGWDANTVRSSLAVPVSHFHVAHWPPYSGYPSSSRARLSPICVTPDFSPPPTIAYSTPHSVPPQPVVHQLN